MSGTKVSGLFRAIAEEAKAAGSTYFAPARAAAKAISDAAHSEPSRGRSIASVAGRTLSSKKACSPTGSSTSRR